LITVRYQSSNTFSGLAAGNYTIKVNEQGSSCTETYNNPVVINTLIIGCIHPNGDTTNLHRNNRRDHRQCDHDNGTLEYSLTMVHTKVANMFMYLAAGNYTISGKRTGSSCENVW
jgi:hypothetical protein